MNKKFVFTKSSRQLSNFSTPLPSPLPAGARGHLAAWLPSCTLQVSVILNLFQDLDETLKHRGQSDVQGDVRRKLVKLCAFTLAEVLITLGIIGVVAATTIPTLISEHKARTISSILKKQHSIWSQVLLMVQNESGYIYDLEMMRDDEDSIIRFAEKVKPYLKLADDCGTGECPGYSVGKITYLNGRSGSATNFREKNYYKMRFADGTTVFLRPTNCTSLEVTCVDIMIDINGIKGPNTLGKDVFILNVRGNNIVLVTGYGIDPSISTYAGCNTKQEGWNCTAWVYYKENMDYLKCADELSWNGKTSCK